MATRKTSAKRIGSENAKKASAKKEINAAVKGRGSASATSMPKAGKDPRGGLTAKGREFFAQKEGAHLRPGVQGPADTPEKMVRKGSFLRRHFAHPRGPMKDAKGEPTRLALSAHAWGEAVPQTMGDARKLAEEGHDLLEQYHATKETGESKPAKSAASKSAALKPAASKSASKKSAKSARKGQAPPSQDGRRSVGGNKGRTKAAAKGASSKP